MEESMANKSAASRRTATKAGKAKAAAGQARSATSTTADTTLRKQLVELRRENEKLHRQLARHEVANFSLKNRVAALEEILQDHGHIENPRLRRIMEEVQERTRGAGDLLSNGPF
jgi:hypothetical protein